MMVKRKADAPLHCTWKQFRGLKGTTADKIMLKVETLETAFYLRYSYTYRLRNIENGKVMLFHKNVGAVHHLLLIWMPRESGCRKKMRAV